MQNIKNKNVFEKGEEKAQRAQQKFVRNLQWIEK